MLSIEEINRILASETWQERAARENRAKLSATPRSLITGTWADIMTPFVNNPVSDIVGLTGIQKAINSASYGSPATLGGSLQTGGIRPEYLEAALDLTPMGKSKKAADVVKSSMLGQFPSTTPGRIINETKAEGGYSVNLPTGIIPKEGLMMGMYKNTDPRNTVTAGLPTRADVVNQAKVNATKYNNPDTYFGTWFNSPENKTYLDVVKRFNPTEKRKATKFGERTGQLSGFDVGGQAEFPVGNWPDFLKSPEFRGRMDEMAGTGREYLSQRPAKEWWDTHGTSFERVYGEDKLPQLSGFTATTAPNTSPTENVQVMSEYMRRLNKGEPIVQPNYRIPDTAMSRQAGGKLGMETGRVNNLLKAGRGDLTALRQDKVREEAAALMGNPDAVVLDRHWARIAEDPSRGIYSNVQEGLISAGKDYALLKSSVTEAAKAAGRSPRDYSADVWTGIRETLRNKAELFGQKYKKGSVSGESKSYSDIFDDLISKKAKHLGISKSKMEKRLREGDAELLSVMLGSPMVYEIYQEYENPQAAFQ